MPRIIAYPLCEARQLLTYSPYGFRVTMGGLFAKLSQWEKRQWYCWSGKGVMDEQGLIPDCVEEFLLTLTEFKTYPEPGVLYVRC